MNDDKKKINVQSSNFKYLKYFQPKELLIFKIQSDRDSGSDRKSGMSAKVEIMLENRHLRTSQKFAE